MNRNASSILPQTVRRMGMMVPGMGTEEAREVTMALHGHLRRRLDGSLCLVHGEVVNVTKDIFLTGTTINKVLDFLAQARGGNIGKVLDRQAQRDVDGAWNFAGADGIGIAACSGGPGGKVCIARRASSATFGRPVARCSIRINTALAAGGGVSKPSGFWRIVDVSSVGAAVCLHDGAVLLAVGAADAVGGLLDLGIGIIETSAVGGIEAEVDDTMVTHNIAKSHGWGTEAELLPEIGKLVDPTILGAAVGSTAVKLALGWGSPGCGVDELRVRREKQGGEEGDRSGSNESTATRGIQPYPETRGSLSIQMEPSRHDDGVVGRALVDDEGRDRGWRMGDIHLSPSFLVRPDLLADLDKLSTVLGILGEGEDDRRHSANLEGRCNFSARVVRAAGLKKVAGCLFCVGIDDVHLAKAGKHATADADLLAPAVEGRGGELIVELFHEDAVDLLAGHEVGTKLFRVWTNDNTHREVRGADAGLDA